MLLPVLLACGGASDPGVGSISPWDPDVGDAAAGHLDVDTLATEAESLLGELLGLNYTELMALYDDRMTLRADGCPTVDLADAGGGLTSDSWYTEGCSTPDGTWFWGQIFGTFQEEVEHTDGFAYTGGEWKGWGAVTDADGGSFSLGGFVQLYVAYDRANDVTLYQSHGRGDVLWTGAGWEDAWFSGDVRPALAIDAWWDDAPRVQVTGTAAGFSGPVVALEATGLVATDPAWGWSCPEELGGRLALRDATGTWATITFDGATTADAVVAPEVCDGCGLATVDGAPIGSVCVSPAPLLDWREAPW